MLQRKLPGTDSVAGEVQRREQSVPAKVARSGVDAPHGSSTHDGNEGDGGSSGAGGAAAMAMRMDDWHAGSLLGAMGLDVAPAIATGAGGAVQRKAGALGGAADEAARVQSAAQAGISGPAQTLPHAETIQKAFGSHDIGNVRAHVGGAATEASQSMGATAYATGRDIAFASAPDLHTAAHEAAHVVQQAHGVTLYGGVGQAGDRYEQHADAVADRVVAGQSAADLLSDFSAGNSSAGGSASADDSRVQRTLSDDLRGALVSPPQSALTGAPVQRTLSTTLRASLDIDGPVNYDRIVEMIHAAPTAERQAVLADQPLRALINSRLTAEWASTVFSSLMEGSQTWRNPPQNDFYTFFVTNNGNGPMPATATMNCWESILYACFLAGQVSASWIRTFYNTATSSPDPNQMIWQQLGFSTALPTYAAPTTSGTGGGTSVPLTSTTATVTPRAGQLLFYHNGGAVPGHVAVSLGGDQAISLWNQPNNIDTVQRIVVTALTGTVYVGDPPW